MLESCEVCSSAFFDVDEFEEYREASEISLFSRLVKLFARH